MASKPVEQPPRLDDLSSMDTINGCTVIQPASIEGLLTSAPRRRLVRTQS